MFNNLSEFYEYYIISYILYSSYPSIDNITYNTTKSTNIYSD
jgi:hypothetical protein